jgi:hypothetical protein
MAVTAAAKPGTAAVTPLAFTAFTKFWYVNRSWLRMAASVVVGDEKRRPYCARGLC